jgi:hypothetical protein
MLRSPVRLDFVPAVAWVLACLRNHGPYPLLILMGEHGSAGLAVGAALWNQTGTFNYPTIPLAATLLDFGYSSEAQLDNDFPARGYLNHLSFLPIIESGKAAPLPSVKTVKRGCEPAFPR